MPTDPVPLRRIDQNRCMLPALGLASLCLLGCIGDNASNSTQTLPHDTLTCVITTPTNSYRIGEVPQISVRIINKTAQEITLMGSLDASDTDRRTPRCHFEIETPYGKPPMPAVCGNMNRLREKDFVAVPPGGAFDPYQRIDEYGFWSDYRLSSRVFSKPGELPSELHLFHRKQGGFLR